LRWIVIGAAAIVAFLYFVPIPFIAYTSDAYVRSDFVEVAPQVSGVVNHVDIANDQKVAVGDLLATSNPELPGAYGLLSMRFVGDDFAVWILLLFGGLYVCCYVKERDGEASCTGHQAAVAVIMSMVQGLAPSQDILPAIERLVGMIGGIVVVVVAQAVAAPLVARAISAILGSGRDAMRDPRRSGEGQGRGVPRGGDLA
jgi:hypothetical protein